MTKKIFSLILILMTFFSISCLAQKNKKQTRVLISTSYGDIKIVLYNETPRHRDNFLKLVKEGFYDSTLFHRVIKDFMIQGGDPNSKHASSGTPLGDGGTGYTIPPEFNPDLIHKKGALAAARMGDGINPNKESSGCQFYIVQGKKFTREEIDKLLKAKNGRRDTPVSYTNKQYKIYETLGGTPHLDMDYTIFGEVIEGMDVIDKIAAVETDRKDRPKEDIVLTIKIVE